MTILYATVLYTIGVGMTRYVYTYTTQTVSIKQSGVYTDAFRHHGAPIKDPFEIYRYDIAVIFDRSQELSPFFFYYATMMPSGTSLSVLRGL